MLFFESKMSHNPHFLCSWCALKPFLPILTTSCQLLSLLTNFYHFLPTFILLLPAFILLLPTLTLPLPTSTYFHQLSPIFNKFLPTIYQLLPIILPLPTNILPTLLIFMLLMLPLKVFTIFYNAQN